MTQIRFDGSRARKRSLSPCHWGSPVVRAYSESLAQIVFNVIPVFEYLGPRDELGSYAFAQDFKRAEMRVAAKYGVCLGILKAQRSNTENDGKKN